MKIYAYVALAAILVSGLGWAGLTLYKAGWNAHVAAGAKEQAKLEKRMGAVKKESAKAIAQARKEANRQRGKYNDAIRRLHATNKVYKDWAAAHIPRDAIPVIWLRGH